MAHRFLYLVAILDVVSHKVLSFRVSHKMMPDFCIEALQEAIARYGAPEIMIWVRSLRAPRGSMC
jgi:putative transposase